MGSQALNSLIGATFGTIFVFVNSGSLPSPVSTALRAAAVAAFLVVLAAAARREPREDARSLGSDRGHYFALVVAGEVLAIAIGLAVLNGPLDAPQAGVAWISLVVGAHFFVLAALWDLPLFRSLGAGMALCGVAGLTLSAADSSARAIDLIGGVVPGAMLLAFSLWGSLKRPQRDGPTPP